MRNVPDLGTAVPVEGTELMASARCPLCGMAEPHTHDDSGNAGWFWITRDDARIVGGLVAHAVETGILPPWRKSIADQLNAFADVLHPAAFSKEGE